MGVNGSITCSSSQIFTLPVRDVLSITLDVSLSQSEVENENFIGSFVEADAEVIGFDVSVDEMPVVDVLDSGDHLVDEHEDGLQGELSERLVEE
jgi:hypothetical protein